jgi:hypothetical protein
MKGKKVTILMSMLALIMLSAVPAFAYEIEVEEGDNDHGYTHHRGQHSSELSGERRVQRW